jgi:hypothetical protein
MAYRPHHANARAYSYAKKRQNVRFLKALVPLTCIGAVAAVVLGAAASSTATPRSAWSPNARPAIRTLPTPIHVQAATGHASSGWTVQATLPEPAQAGDLLVAYVVWSNTGSVSVSDSRGDGYATAVASKTWGSNDRAGVLFAKNIAGGTTKVTATLSASVTFATLGVHEYANVDAIDPLDGSSAAAGSQGMLDSGPIASVGAGDLVFAAGSAIGGVSEGGMGFSVRSMAAGSIVEDRIAKTVGTYNATAAHDSGTWVMQAAAFKARKPHGRMPAVSASPTTSAPPTTSAAPSPTPTVTSSPPSSTTSAPPPSTSSAPPSGACALPAHPNASCTGVPPGTNLSDYTGPCTISVANTVIDSKIVNCSRLTVQAAHVTIKNSKVNTNIWLDQDMSGSATWSMAVIDTEVDAGPHDIPAICCGKYTVTRVNAHGGHNGAQCENRDSYCTITDSYLHGQYMPPGSTWHLGGFLSDGSDNITLTHNTIVCDHPVDHGEGCTGDINLIPNFAPVSGALIENNLLGANTGSAYCTFGGEKSTSPYPHSDHVVYRNNVFERGTNGRCADYGPVTFFNINNPGNEWVNNRWDSGELVAPVN